MTSTDSVLKKRSGLQTRAAIQQIALDLFTAKGYEATTMREIADALSIKKASLYYHFAGKEEILRSLFEHRGDEAYDLLEWIRTQRQEPELVRVAVLRWVESFTGDKLRGIRFTSSNPLLVRATAGPAGERISSALTSIIDSLVPLLPHPDVAAQLQLRMALLSINAAVEAASGTDFTDEQVIAAARQHAATIVDTLID